MAGAIKRDWRVNDRRRQLERQCIDRSVKVATATQGKHTTETQQEALYYLRQLLVQCSPRLSVVCSVQKLLLVACLVSVKLGPETSHSQCLEVLDPGALVFAQRAHPEVCSLSSQLFESANQ